MGSGRTRGPCGEHAGALGGHSAQARGQIAASLCETHSAIVFFVGDRAYKLKKPVDLGFLDFRRREDRERVCHREVELNRRLAPDVYLGVADVLGPGGEPCDHMVVMRRLPAERRLATLAAAGAPLQAEVIALARLLAAFHASATAGPEIDRVAGCDAMRSRWEANTAEMGPFLTTVVDADVAGRVATLAERYLRGRRPLFEARVARGRARDGHGDLLADDIFCLPDGPRVLDCVEFDDRLRWGDVLADVAFLAMDLERLGRADLADRFLETYREFSADAWPGSLAHHHIAYRAQVRAKVACLRWSQGRAEAADDARAHLGLALDHLESGRVRLVVVGGLPGTGKSTVAAGVAASLGAVVLRSDEVRKQLVGLDPQTPAPALLAEGIYRRERTAETYAELLSRARTCLSHGESVVLDATWHDPSWRDAARALADDAVADMTELRCAAPPSLAAARVAARAARGGDPSDADRAVVESMAASDAPWPTAVTVDTTEAPAAVLRHALASLMSVG